MKTKLLLLIALFSLVSNSKPAHSKIIKSDKSKEITKSSSFCLPWKEGYYSTYFAQYKNSWESYTFLIYKKVKNGQWIILATVKQPERTFNLAFRAIEHPNFTKSPLPITPLKIFSSRGKEPTKEDTSYYFAKFVNFFNVRAAYINNKTKAIKNTKKITPLLGIKTVHALTDPWPAFGFTIFHELNPKIPILNIFKSILSDGSTKIYLTSFGMNTRDLKNYVYFPTFIDFTHNKLIKHKKFSLTYPATWVLTPQKANGRDFYFAQLGGNIHAGTMSVELSSGEPASIIKEYRLYKKNEGVFKRISHDLYKYHLKSSYKITKQNKYTGTIFISDFYKINEKDRTKKDQVGISIRAILLSKDKKRFASIIIFTNFSTDNPRQKQLPIILEKAKKIIGSFEFR